MSIIKVNLLHVLILCLCVAPMQRCLPVLYIIHLVDVYVKRQVWGRGREGMGEKGNCRRWERYTGCRNGVEKSLQHLFTLFLGGIATMHAVKVRLMQGDGKRSCTGFG